MQSKPFFIVLKLLYTLLGGDIFVSRPVVNRLPSDRRYSATSGITMLAALLRRISRLPSQSPIEAITFFFVLVTLVYFQLLQAVQDSEM
jgi:hypothetical protein